MGNNTTSFQEYLRAARALVRLLFTGPIVTVVKYVYADALWRSSHWGAAAALALTASEPAAHAQRVSFTMVVNLSAPRCRKPVFVRFSFDSEWAQYGAIYPAAMRSGEQSENT